MKIFFSGDVTIPGDVKTKNIIKRAFLAAIHVLEWNTEEKQHSGGEN